MFWISKWVRQVQNLESLRKQYLKLGTETSLTLSQCIRGLLGELLLFRA